MSHLANPEALIQVDEVDGEFHEKGVDRFARNNPQTFARGQALVVEQPDPPFGAGVGLFGAVGQQRLAGLIAD